MKIGLYGGSFDPIHRGHVSAPRAALRELGLDRVIFLPTAHPPHKVGQQMAPALARYAMVELALLPYAELRVSSFELLRQGPAYTVDTVRHFRRQLLRAELHLLIGADSLAQLDHWHEWRALLGEVALAVLARPGWERSKVEAELGGELREALDAAQIHWLGNPPVDLTATQLRRALAAGRRPPAGALAPAVLDYMRKYDLYRAKSAV